MPESVQDRPTSAWEHIWLLTKKGKYFYDASAVRVTPGSNSHGGTPNKGGKKRERFDPHNGALGIKADEAGANLRNYWLLGPEPSREEHFASFPTELVRRCIAAGTSEHGVCVRCGSPWERVEVGWRPTCGCGEGVGVMPGLVLDPFVGSGTTVMQAVRMGRRGLGLELNAEYVAMARRRAGGSPLMDLLISANSGGERESEDES